MTSASATPGEPGRLATLAGLTLALLWAVIALAALAAASVKLHAPALLSHAPWLTYGRLQAAGSTGLLFGFLLPAGALLGLGLLARLAAAREAHPGLVGAGAVLWHAGVAAGLAGILAGANTGREWLEFPLPVLPFLILAAALWAVAGLQVFHARAEADSYPAAWFLLVALLALPWFLSAAPLLLGHGVSAGILQTVTQRWVVNGLVSLAAGGFALAALLYLLPVAAGRPLASRPLVLLGFWTWVFFTPWAVAFHGDPFPRWLVSAGVAGRILAAMALLALAWNFFQTLAGAWGAARRTAAGRLAVAALLGWLAAGVLGFFAHLRGPAGALRLTWFAPGLEFAFLLGFVGLALLALLAAAWPALTGRPASFGAAAGLIVAGTALLVLPLLAGGLLQGRGLADPARPFLEVLRLSLMPVRLTSLGWLLLLAGHGVLLGQALAVWAAEARRLAAACATLNLPAGAKPLPSRP
jgi:cytochrome c oxidase cbb3-type subunit 1